MPLHPIHDPKAPATCGQVGASVADSCSMCLAGELMRRHGTATLYDQPPPGMDDVSPMLRSVIADTVHGLAGLLMATTSAETRGL